jgi:general secretion pathway protein G
MMRQHNTRRNRRQRGMSLIEIMVVITIMALVMGAVAVAVFPQFKKASCKTAWTEAQSISQAVGQYRTDNSNDCPKSLDELKSGHFLKSDPIDPWGKPFQFKCPGEQDTDTADVWSSGADKQDGTADDVKGWVRIQEQCK